MQQSLQKAVRFIRPSDGPTAMEYAVVLALIVIVCLAAMKSVGTSSRTKLISVAHTIGS